MKFALSALAFLILLALGFRYEFHYSWTFLGKFAAYVIVPLAMGWAGVHLAAEVKEAKQRRLWQSIFAMMFIFAVLVSFYVEKESDAEHKQELSDLRTGIVEDMARYLLSKRDNNEQSVTTQRFDQFAKRLDEKIGALSKPSLRQSRVLDDDHARKFQSAILGKPDTVAVFADGISQDVLPLGKQICDLFTNAKWAVNCVGVPGYSTEIPVTLPTTLNGLHCYTATVQVREAFAESGLGCVYENGPFHADGVTLGMPTIVIGNAVVPK